nr:TIGR03986 family CRISPR-associated RAMP protein [Desulfobacterales bacterium]
MRIHTTQNGKRYAKDIEPLDRGQQFINPYNFIRPDDVVKKDSRISHHQFIDPNGEKEHHSGQIICNLQIETPIFIPDPEETYYNIKIDTDSLPKNWIWENDSIEVLFKETGDGSVKVICEWTERDLEQSEPITLKDLDQIRAGEREGYGILHKGIGEQKHYLETKLPLKNGHKVMKFFRLRDEPAIPPTSLKGMIRSVVEAASNSCFSVLQGEKLGIRRRPEWYDAPDTLLAGKILEIPSMSGTKGKVKKMAAYKISHRDKDFEQYKNKEDFNGKEISIKIVDRQVQAPDDPQASNTKIGYLKTSSEGIGRGSKDYERVFLDPDELTDEELPKGFKREPKVFDLPYEIQADYGVANKNNKFEHTKYLNVGDVVWFRTTDENEVKEIGFTQIYRLPFRKAVRDRLYKDLHPCSDVNHLCPACSIFGRVVEKPSADDGQSSVARKVSFSIGESTSENTYHQDDVRLKILSSPKPTFYNFYVISPDNPAQVRDYDGQLVIDEKGNVDENNISPVVLRGRKFYWHYPDARNKREIYTREDGTQDSQNSTVELFTQGTFTFTVDFHNLTDYELGLLLYSLELEGEDSDLRHKFGMGKPLGLGSVKVTIDKMLLINRKERYRSILSDGIRNEQEYKDKFILKGFKKVQAGEQTDDRKAIEQAFDNLPYIQDLKVMLAFKNFHGLEIKYPRARSKRDGKPYGYEWFQQNKKKLFQLPRR